jgi:hypothetical protein
LAGFGLRIHEVGNIALWLDDTAFFNRSLYSHPPQSLVEYSVNLKEHSTNTVGWPGAVWISARLFGPTPAGAKMASVTAGTLAIPAVFFLVYFVLLRGSPIKPFLPSLVAAVIAAVSINQIELSQRLYAYGATALFSALLILAHLHVTAALGKPDRTPEQWNLALLFYAFSGGMALCVNSSLMLMVLISALILGWMVFRVILRSQPEQRVGLLAAAGLCGLALLFSMLLNLKNPAYGYRYYMQSYYHALDAGAPAFLLRQAYDLLTYNLNLFYNSALYWPQKANPALLAPVLVCVLGWWAAAAGRFGPLARHLAIFGLLAISLPAALSILGTYTFGGDRRSLYLSPFIFAFTALGCYLLGSVRKVRWIAGVAGAAYLVLWAVNLPAFYRERTSPYSSDQLVTVWRESGKLPIYVGGGGADAIRYAFRRYPEARIEPVPFSVPPAPYLYLSLHWPLEQDRWDVNHSAKLREKNYQATLLLERPAKYMASWEYPTSLYFPPNGLWIYRVTE